jgi:hypothetical protein
MKMINLVSLMTRGDALPLAALAVRDVGIISLEGGPACEQARRSLASPSREAGAATMEANEEEAQRAKEIGRTALQSQDYTRAIRFLTISERLAPNADTRQLRESCRACAACLHLYTRPPSWSANEPCMVSKAMLEGRGGVVGRGPSYHAIQRP